MAQPLCVMELPTLAPTTAPPTLRITSSVAAMRGSATN
jgi:hypothetical protein